MYRQRIESVRFASSQISRRRVSKESEQKNLSRSVLSFILFAVFVFVHAR